MSWNHKRDKERRIGIYPEAVWFFDQHAGTYRAVWAPRQLPDLAGVQRYAFISNALGAFTPYGRGTPYRMALQSAVPTSPAPGRGISYSTNGQPTDGFGTSPLYPSPHA